MPSAIDLTGVKVGRWHVLALSARHHTTPKGKRLRLWHCRCECGVEREVMGTLLGNGGSQSCGCLKVERATVHGYQKKSAGAKNLTYRCWRSMKTRCTNPRSDSWARYGGRGITFDPAWSDFANFVKDMGECPVGHSIDRIDPDGHYTRTNCRWASQSEQALNKTNSRHLTIGGVTKPLVTWAREWGVNPQTIHEQRKRGWTTDQIAARAAARG